MHSGREPLNHHQTPWDGLQGRRFAHWPALAVITLTGLAAIASTRHLESRRLPDTHPSIATAGAADQRTTARAITIAVIVWTSTSTTEVNGSVRDIRTGFFGGPGTGSHADYFGEILRQVDDHR